MSGLFWPVLRIISIQKILEKMQKVKNVTIKLFIVTNIKETAEIMEKFLEKNPEDEKLLRSKIFAFKQSQPIYGIRAHNGKIARKEPGR